MGYISLLFAWTGRNKIKFYQLIFPFGSIRLSYIILALFRVYCVLCVCVCPKISDNLWGEVA